MERRNFFKFFPVLLVAPLAIMKAVASKNEPKMWFDRTITRTELLTQLDFYEEFERITNKIETPYGDLYLIEHPLFAAEKHFTLDNIQLIDSKGKDLLNNGNFDSSMRGTGDWLDAPMTKKRYDLAKENKA